jgi:hypothetical protein
MFGKLCPPSWCRGRLRKGDGQAGSDAASAREDGADRAQDSVEKVRDRASTTAAEDTATEDAADGASNATENTTEQVAEQVADGAAGEQVLQKLGDGLEEVAEQGQGSRLLDGTAGGTTAENAGQSAEAADREGKAADAHGHGLVEAGHGVDESLHEAVGIGGVLLDEMILKASQPGPSSKGRAHAYRSAELGSQPR